MIGDLVPRPPHLRAAATLAPPELRPLVGTAGPTFASAMFAIGTWGASAAFREQVLASARFPLDGDVPAFLVVNQLIYRGVANPTALADAIDTSRSNLSKILNRLASTGLVQRIADPHDRRSVAIALTAAGREAGERIVQATAALQPPAGPDWTDADAVELERLIIKLARALDRLPQHPLAAASGVELSDD
ncbi:MarR family winged helix-turn-helix transcriptional regulator [Demequina phytophila]|uniref:MarR family winged helix-turn-helix transcriptional regulator n=1 Tax=Demequina phytophila TaxID=1638981 RepID=UPI0014706118|nr:MarR family transcriptional regulator [Demequina phytophila]